MFMRYSISKNGHILSSIVFVFAFICISAGSLWAAPSTSQVKKMWERQYQGASVLGIQYKGGERTTNQLNNKTYRVPVGTCWSYDVVEIQTCGCRSFDRVSVCCSKGSTTDCEIRIGNSNLVDCKKYGKPKYGLSGNTEPAKCKQSRTQSACFNKMDNLYFGPGSTIGPCKGAPYFTCPNGATTFREFTSRKCGPTPEDCGCQIDEMCSDEKSLQCYKEWKRRTTRMP